MKMTEELKNKIKTAKTKEEVQKIFTEAGVELTDEDLDGVSGGVDATRMFPSFRCPYCGCVGFFYPFPGVGNTAYCCECDGDFILTQELLVW